MIAPGRLLTMLRDVSREKFVQAVEEEMRRNPGMPMKVYWITAVFVVMGISLQPVSAQTHCPMHQLQDQIPPDRLSSPEKLMGIGTVHLSITATPEAQVWFDQGLNLIHDFWDFESARAFEQSIRVDPKCAMCYWGLYQAESFYHSLAKDYAQEALQKAIRFPYRADLQSDLP